MTYRELCVWVEMMRRTFPVAYIASTLGVTVQWVEEVIADSTRAVSR